MSKETVTLKLIGAPAYISIPAGLTTPVQAGEFAEVPKEFVERFLAETYGVGKQYFPVWSKDPDAEVVLMGEPLISLEERAWRDKENAVASEQLARVTAEKEEAEAREAKLLERIEKLEKLFDEGDAKKPTPRKRKAATPK